jgi:hypothetical protein
MIDASRATGFRRWWGVLILLMGLVFGLPGASSAADAEPPTTIWHDRDAAGDVRVHLYFFWSDGCPHCRSARHDISEIGEQESWLVVHEYNVTRDADHLQRYRDLAGELGETPRAVPGLAFCRRLIFGAPPSAQLREQLVACRHEGEGGEARAQRLGPQRLDIPGLGSLDISGWSLPLATVVIAGLDAFNPCAFFVLLFLMSLLIHAQRRSRMIAVAGVFIFFSGLWYFLFMAAWLNVFLWVGELRVITVVAGLIAVVMAALNIKDFVRPGVGPSLSIPESAKPGLFRRMRRLVKSSSLVPVVSGTVVLAAAANSYELLCTAGFPMVYTRILTLHHLSAGRYYLLLALYNVVYVIPLAVIVGVFVKTLGSRKLQEHEGRALKLLSGVMMLGLGVLLVVAPDLLGNLLVALLLLVVAVLVTYLASTIQRRHHPGA